MTLPPVLASKFVEAGGYYIHKAWINYQATTETTIVLHNGDRYER